MSRITVGGGIGGGGASASQIWAYATRKLTGMDGQARSDLLGEDASFEAGSGTRKTRIDRIMAAESEAEGSLAMTGPEQTLVQSELGVQHHIEGMVDLSPVIAGDTVVIRIYMSIVTPLSYVKYAEETYTGPLSPSLMFIYTKVAKYGLKVTAQQTGGAYRTLKYQFFTRRRE